MEENNKRPPQKSESHDILTCGVLLLSLMIIGGLWASSLAPQATPEVKPIGTPTRILATKTPDPSEIFVDCAILTGNPTCGLAPFPPIPFQPIFPGLGY